MTDQTQTRNTWIDRYVAEVGRMLPAAKRADVEMEMRSLIEEEVDARVGVGGSTDERAYQDIVLDVLHSFGHPAQMASRYGAPQYLIGPALYPTFVALLRIVLAVAVGANLLALAVEVGVNRTPVSIAGILLDLAESLFYAGGIFVLIFALVERLNRPALAKESVPGAWDPRSLPEIEDRAQIKVGETIIEMVFMLAALLWINFYLDRLAFYRVPGEGIQSLAIFSPEFRQHVPLLTIWLGLDLVLHIVLLARGRWTRWLRLADLAIQGIGVAVLIRMLTGPDLAAWPVVEPAYRVTVGLILVVTLFEAAKQGYSLFSSWNSRPRLKPSG